MFVARNGVFLEKEFLIGEKSGRTVQFEEVRDEPIRQDSTSDANVAEQVGVPMAKHRHKPTTTKVGKALPTVGIIIVGQ